MATPTPGVNVSITASPPTPSANAVTGTWFVTGQTQQGPTNVAIPVTSMTDYANFLGGRVSYGFLFDALTEYFNDGGVLAYVSRLVGPGAGTATVALKDASAATTLNVSACGAGAWGNNLSVVVAAGTASNSYTLAILNNGVQVGSQSPNLFTPAGAQTWFASLNSWLSQVLVVNAGSVTVAPGNSPVVGTFALTSGSDDTADVVETQWTNALLNFPGKYGPGQVSAPGHTTQVGYENLANHAQTFNRYAILDVNDSSSASNLVAQAVSAQVAATLDPSYAAMFAPWVTIPGIVSTTPGLADPIPTRTIPPSAVFAALAAANDRTQDANNAVAGSNGTSQYAIGVTQSYSAVDRATINGAGINLLRVLSSTPNNVTIYGNLTLAIDPNWFSLNNARFRMQLRNDFDIIGEGYVFDEIDAQGHIFSKLNASLAGKCQQYYGDMSIFGATSADAFSVNTGPQVNTPTTIGLGQINAIVSLIMSPAGNTVDINVNKLSVTSTVPS